MALERALFATINTEVLLRVWMLARRIGRLSMGWHHTFAATEVKKENQGGQKADDPMRCISRRMPTADWTSVANLCTAARQVRRNIEAHLHMMCLCNGGFLIPSRKAADVSAGLVI